MAQSFPDSLLETQTQTLDEEDDDRQQQQLQEPPPQSQSADKASPSLSRNGSSSRLNAKAPEFVPRTTDSIPSPRLVAPPSPQPQPIHHHHHVYPPNPPFHHVPVPVPVQNPHHHHPYPPPPPPPHHHHHVLPPPPALHFHNPHPHPPHHHLNHSHHNNNHQHHHRHSHAGGSGSASAVDHQQQQHDQAPAGAGDPDHPVSSSKNGLTDEATQKILNQVEYYFSDVNLATTDHLIRFINKDPEGFVPISVVASFKKIKALISSNSQLAGILRNSGKLIVSEDGKKVRRQQPLTDPDMEELQSRIIIAENLPEDHCHQNLMKIFSAVGSVKTIRTCQPQASNGGASSASRTGKADHALFSNKLHAFVEYESIELAEKAVAELNDEGTWRNGLRVRLLLKRQAKPAQGRSKKAGQENETHNKEDDASVKPAQAKHAQGRSKKAGQESEVRHKEDDTSTSEQNETNEKHIDPAQQSDAQSHEHPGEEHPNSNEKEGGHKKGRNRRGKGRGRSHYNHNNSRGNHAGNPNGSANPEHTGVGKHQPPGPRMPDGTRGFSMGRGKPISATNHV